MGWIEKRNAFKNLYPSNTLDGEIVTRYEHYPINSQGDPVTTVSNENKHGTITETDNGFIVSGINASAPFVCPDNFEGTSCKLKPICSKEDVDGIKLLDLKQFNALQMYGLSSPSSYNLGGGNIVDGISNVKNKTHPRIRVQCLNNSGDYTIVPCTDNMLIDPVTKTCKPYDICIDKVNGFKHQYIINENQKLLETNEYHVCTNYKSVIHKCDEKSAFSVKRSECVSKSKCYNKDGIRLPKDKNSYILCSGDTGTVKTCKFGVAVKDGFIYCNVPNCFPNKYTYEDHIIKYTIGEVWCTKGVEHKLKCSNKNMNKKYKYSWGTDFSFNFPMWPEHVYDEKVKICKTPDNSIIKPNADVRFRWGPAMVRYWPFDPKTEQFKCGDYLKPKMKIDYKNEVTVPRIDLHKYFIDLTTPCIGPENMPISYLNLFEELSGGTINHFLKQITTYSPKVGGLPMIFGMEIKMSKINTNAALGFFLNTMGLSMSDIGVMWPTVVETETFDKRTLKNIVFRKYFTFNIKKASNIVDVYTSETPPLGFIDPVNIESNKINLMIYRNWPNFVPKNELANDTIKTIYLFLIGDRISAQN